MVFCSLCQTFEIPQDKINLISAMYFFRKGCRNTFIVFQILIVQEHIIQKQGKKEGGKRNKLRRKDRKEGKKKKYD